MLYLSSYTIILFTLQLILILSKTPSGWLLTLWGLLFFCVYRYKTKFYYPQDHPHAGQRRKMVTLWLVAFTFLSCSHLYFTYYLETRLSSAIQFSLEREYGTLDEFLVAERPVYVSGTLNSPVHIDGDRVSFTLAVARMEDWDFVPAERIMIQAYLRDIVERERYSHLSPRSEWAGYILLQKPSSARNPGAFDYQQYLADKQIYFIGRVDGIDWWYQPNETWQAKFMGHLDQQREKWLAQVELLFSSTTAPIVQALTVGYRAELAPELVDMYQGLGIIHLLAISGLHVGIILWGLYYLLSFLPITRERIYLFLLIFLPVFMYVSGGQVSAVRAGLMGMVALIFLRFQWWKHSLLGLYIVYLLMLFYNPYYLKHIGFQLSFAVTFILIAAYPTLEKALFFIPNGLRQVLGISFLAQLASLPIILFHFYQFSPLSLLINIFLVPIYSFIFIPGAFILTLLSFLQLELVSIFVLLYEQMLQGLHQWLYKLLEWPEAIISTGRPSLWWLGIYIGIMILFLIYMEKGRLCLAWSGVGLLISALIALIIWPYFELRAEVMILDVGQGEAIVIELPYRKEVILIDLGGQIPIPKEEWQERKQEFEVGRDIILPYLRYRGINKIDKLIITHGHYDHLGGIQGILGKIKIGQVLRSSLAPYLEFEQEWLEKIWAADIPIYGIGAGDWWGNTEAYFQVLFPAQREELQHVSGNPHDYNLVLWNQIYQTSILWTGDVEEFGERIMIEMYPQLQADLLNIAHHGSKTSTSKAWLKQVQAKIALISVGRHNRFGHPHESVMERLAAEEVEVYRTDLHGGIRIQIEPERIKLLPTLQ